MTILSFQFITIIVLIVFNAIDRVIYCKKIDELVNRIWEHEKKYQTREEMNTN